MQATESHRDRFSPALPPAGRPAARARRGALLAAISAVAASAIVGACLPRRTDTLPAPMAWVNSGAAAREDAAASSNWSASVVGKPYRDLQQHTAQDLVEVAGIDVSPDGGTVLYASSQDGPTPNLYLKELRSASVVRKTAGPQSDIHPRYSPDGRSIAFASNRDGGFDIWVIPTAGGGGAEQVTSSPDDELHPSWSPDGRKIAVCRLSASQGWTLWVHDRDIQSSVELGPGLFPDWSPTGEWIAFQKPSERPPYWYSLWIIRPDGSEVRQVLAGEGFGGVDPAWSPAGDQLAFTSVKNLVRKGGGAAPASAPGALCVLELSRGKMYRLTEDLSADSAPAWGLGGRIYFSSERQGQRGIWSLLPPEVAQ